MNAQDNLSGHGITVKKLFIDYPGTLEDNILGLGDGYEVGYLKNLGGNLNLSIPIKAGVVRLEGEELNTSILGIDAQIQYMLGDSKKIVQPYALAGLGLVAENMEDIGFQAPIALGINYNIERNTYLNLQVEYRLAFDEGRNNLQIGLGFVHKLGGQMTEEMEEVKEVMDSDGDGVADDMDQCPDIPGKKAFAGCPDTDGDGIQDNKDDCPEYPGLAEFNGCPDTDEDGIPDNMDECPEEAGVPENDGCPKEDLPDADGDGIADKDDRCPNVAGTAATNGCPDEDGDGVNNYDDKCPKVPGPKEYDGCPDTDGDGVHDGDDRCPRTVGPMRNFGCPEISKEDKEVLEFAVQNVNFEHNSSWLTSDSKPILDQIAAMMNRYPEYNLTISGHTDSTGSSVYNQNMSEKRAKSCYTYLVEQGVNPSRIKYAGYGESKPISSNETLDGRALNRRVEFDLKL